MSKPRETLHPGRDAGSVYDDQPPKPEKTKGKAKTTEAPEPKE